MIRKEEFLKEFNGHCNSYSSFMVIDVEIDDLIRVLNEIDPDMCAGSGIISGRSISFEICKESPDLIYDITRKLHCRGYSDIDGWYGDTYMEAAKDGEPFDDFKAEWTNGAPERRDWDTDDTNKPDEEIDWDSFVTITDNATGETFNTGGGAVDYKTMTYWKDIVDKH